MAVNIDWNLLKTPDIGNAFTQGYDSGRTKATLGALATNPNDTNALNALMQASPEKGMAFQDRQLKKAQAAQESRYKQAQIGKIEQEQAGQRAEALAGVAYAAKKVPYEQRRAFIAQQMPILSQIGFTPDQIAQFDPTDTAIDGVISQAVPIKDQYSAYTKQQEPYTLAPGSARYGGDGHVIAQQPFAPQYRSVGEGQSLVEIPPAGGGDPYAPVMQAEGGTNPDGSFRTSPKGAVGPGQIMPTTGPEAAAYAGLPWDEQRYRSDPQYNEAIGRAYHAVQLAKFDGNPAAAAAAYNAGPGRARQAGAPQTQGDWQQRLPAETQDYIRKVAPGFVSGGARVIAQGAPKQPPPQPQGQRMTPQQVQAEGLDPNVVYYRGPDGVPKPVGGQPKPAVNSNAPYSQSAIDAFNRAIDTAGRLKTHPGMSAAVGVKGLTGGFVGGWVMPGTDAADFRAELDAMKAQVFLPMVQSMKGMGALSNAEGQKLTDAIGALDPKMSEGAFKASLDRIVGDLKAYRDRGAPKAAGGGVAPPAGAIQMLKSNPNLRSAFDAKYGPGASSRVLGR